MNECNDGNGVVVCLVVDDDDEILLIIQLELERNLPNLRFLFLLKGRNLQ